MFLITDQSIFLVDLFAHSRRRLVHPIGGPTWDRSADHEGGMVSVVPLDRVFGHLTVASRGDMVLY